MLKALQAFFSLALCPLFGSPSASSDCSFETRETFKEGEYGGKSYKLYVPSTYDKEKASPLLVMLHGCTQCATDFAIGTEMNMLAEEHNFLVLYPEQDAKSNPNKCWNWFEPLHQARGRGEPAAIAGMIEEIKEAYTIDNHKVFIAGMSAGGAMSIIMAAAYPEVFSGLGVGAGLEYKGATSVFDALNVMNNGGPNPFEQGYLAYKEMGERARVIPTIVFHGTSDTTVAPINGEQVVSQWIVTNDLVERHNAGWICHGVNETIKGKVRNGKEYTHDLYRNKRGESIVEKYTVLNMGHAWSGGNDNGSFTDSEGPHASKIMWDFFIRENRKNGYSNQKSS
ncbi:extracellular catalytic domain type 1 short-chain-length polyhydroxyalkanoate depolymerase [Priestia endophytica]|uniref:extracellular catalytic domain type 1 short-chain-length polyhydroxyalkanoate depolymerase n=1 Tax=Priestia endophytica TaxID=135735 RepID=UPI002E2015E1|nr:PHB depolymerase family esterase [Priestia endophytica]MED4069842.1 PHB depolymerase family esterase [Priestia endophytica]